MSRTDKTKPWRVRVAEHNPREIHDHRDGICDLPASPLDLKWMGCHWDQWALYCPDNCCHGCGCYLCAQQDERHAATRRDRHATAALLAQGAIERERRPRARKDTWAWCRGKVGRRHVEEVRLSKRGGRRISLGVAPCRPPWNDASSWSCSHEVGCKVCGKVLYRVQLPESCPTWRKQH